MINNIVTSAEGGTSIPVFPGGPDSPNITGVSDNAPIADCTSSTQESANKILGQNPTRRLDPDSLHSFL